MQEPEIKISQFTLKDTASSNKVSSCEKMFVSLFINNWNVSFHFAAQIVPSKTLYVENLSAIRELKSVFKSPKNLF